MNGVELVVARKGLESHHVPNHKESPKKEMVKIGFIIPDANARGNHGEAVEDSMEVLATLASAREELESGDS